MTLYINQRAFFQTIGKDIQLLKIKLHTLLERENTAAIGEIIDCHTEQVLFRSQKVATQ